MDAVLTPVLASFISVVATALATVYLLKPRKEQLKANAAKELSEANSNAITSMQGSLARLEVELANARARTAELYKELQEVETRRIQERRQAEVQYNKLRSDYDVMAELMRDMRADMLKRKEAERKGVTRGR